jgi:hypothetical protein
MFRQLSIVSAASFGFPLTISAAPMMAALSKRRDYGKILKAYRVNWPIKDFGSLVTRHIHLGLSFAFHMTMLFFCLMRITSIFGYQTLGFESSSPSACFGGG